MLLVFFQVLSALGSSDASGGRFIEQRVTEILSGTVHMEREQMLRRTMERLSAKTAEIKDVQSRWADLQSSISARDAMLADRERMHMFVGGFWWRQLFCWVGIDCESFCLGRTLRCKFFFYNLTVVRFLQSERLHRPRRKKFCERMRSSL